MFARVLYAQKLISLYKTNHIIIFQRHYIDTMPSTPHHHPNPPQWLANVCTGNNLLMFEVI